MNDQKNFVGREKNLHSLKEFLSRPSAEIAAVYGRRRVGKSTLIEHAISKYVQADAQVIKLEGLEGQSSAKQIANFVSQLEEQGYKISKGKLNWPQTLNLLVQKAPNKQIIIFIDELQWMANYRNDFVSNLKLLWDKKLSKIPGLKLILCGSIASFMIKKVIHSKAFFGRIETVLHIRPFELNETMQMLPNHNKEDVLRYHMIVGGIPLYLLMLRKEQSLILGLNKLAFLSEGFFFREYERIFISHFGSQKRYELIIKSLSNHPQGLTRLEIAKKIKAPLGGKFSEQIDNLLSAEFIGEFKPIFSKESSKLSKYYLKDPYLKFYFTFVKPNIEKIKNEQVDLFLKIANSPKYYSYLGYAFENMCLSHTKKIAKILGISGIEYNTGVLYDKNVQIDLIFDRADGVLSLCEIKYQQQSINTSIIDEIEKKHGLLQKRYPRRTIQNVLITNSPPTKDLVVKDHFSKIILGVELID